MAIIRNPYSLPLVGPAGSQSAGGGSKRQDKRLEHLMDRGQFKTARGLKVDGKSPGGELVAAGGVKSPQDLVAAGTHKWRKDAGGAWQAVPKSASGMGAPVKNMVTGSAGAPASAPATASAGDTFGFSAKLDKLAAKSPTVRGDLVGNAPVSPLDGNAPVMPGSGPVAIGDKLHTPVSSTGARGRGPYNDQAYSLATEKIKSQIFGIADPIATELEKSPIVGAAQGAANLIGGTFLEVSGTLGHALGGGQKSWENAATGKYLLAKGFGGNPEHVDQTIPASVDFALRESAGTTKPEEYGSLIENLDWYKTSGVGKIATQLATNKILSAAGAMDWNSAYERKLALATLSAGGEDSLALVGAAQKAAAVASSRKAAGLDYDPNAVKTMAQIVGDVFGRAGVEGRLSQAEAAKNPENETRYLRSGSRARPAAAKVVSAAQTAFDVQKAADAAASAQRSADFQSQKDFEAGQKANEAAYRERKYATEKVTGDYRATVSGVLESTLAGGGRQAAIDLAQARMADIEAKRAQRGADYNPADKFNAGRKAEEDAAYKESAALVRAVEGQASKAKVAKDKARDQRSKSGKEGKDREPRDMAPAASRGAGVRSNQKDEDSYGSAADRLDEKGKRRTRR